MLFELQIVNCQKTVKKQMRTLIKYKANHPSNDRDASDNLIRLPFQCFASFIIIIITSWCHVVVLKVTRLGDTFCALHDVRRGSA